MTKRRFGARPRGLERRYQRHAENGSVAGPFRRIAIGSLDCVVQTVIEVSYAGSEISDFKFQISNPKDGKSQSEARKAKSEI
jgi:hypothetical protein